LIWVKCACSCGHHGGAALAELHRRPAAAPVQLHLFDRAANGWFTEGFDTLDLKEAKALLAELAY
jgi:hypothetical protein